MLILNAMPLPKKMSGIGGADLLNVDVEQKILNKLNKRQ